MTAPVGPTRADNGGNATTLGDIVEIVHGAPARRTDSPGPGIPYVTPADLGRLR